MSNQTSTDGTDMLDAVLSQWRAAVDAHQPEHVAALITTDAIFQGQHPYTAGVGECYSAQPTGMTPVYTLRETCAPLVRGSADVQCGQVVARGDPSGLSRKGPP